MKIELGPLPEPDCHLMRDTLYGTSPEGYQRVMRQGTVRHVVDGPLRQGIVGQEYPVFTADQMRSYAEQEVAKERERCARIIEKSLEANAHTTATFGPHLDFLLGAIRNGGAK